MVRSELQGRRSPSMSFFHRQPSPHNWTAKGEGHRGQRQLAAAVWRPQLAAGGGKSDLVNGMVSRAEHPPRAASCAPPQRQRAAAVHGAPRHSPSRTPPRENPEKRQSKTVCTPEPSGATPPAPPSRGSPQGG